MASKMTSGELLTRTEAAVADQTTAGKLVTFTAVAATGVSRATLYRHPELRAVDRHRTRPTATALAAEVRQLRTTLEAVAAKTRHQEERLRRLERGSAIQHL